MCGCVYMYVHIYLMELQYMSHGTATKDHELAYENASISHGNPSLKFLVEGYSCLPNNVGYCHCMDDFQILEKIDISEDITFFVHGTWRN